MTDPTRALEVRLQQHTRFQQLVRLDQCPSTQDVAANLDGGDAVVWAEEQSAGRGREGRAWSGSAGQDVECSLRVTGLRIQDPTALAAAIPTAVLSALRELSGLALNLKWPNDVLFEGRKLCGILIDARTQPGLTYIVGVGVNVNRTHFPAELAETATSLALSTSLEFDRDEVVLALAREVGHAIEAVTAGSIAELEDRFRDGLGLIGRPVTIRTNRDELVEGTLEALDFRQATLADGRSLPIGTMRALSAQ